MKNLPLAFFTLAIFSFSQLSMAYDDDKIGLSLGGFWGASMLKPNASYTKHPEKGSNDGPATTDRVIDLHQKRANILSTMGIISYSILDWLEVEGQLAFNLGDKTLFKYTYTEDNGGNATSALKVNSNAAGVFSVFKFGNDAYLKAKIGLGVNITEYKTSAANEKLTDFGLAAGLAVGQKLGPGAVEFMYMRYPDTRISNSKVNTRFNGAEINQGGHERSNLSMSSKQKLEFFSIGYVYTF